MSDMERERVRHVIITGSSMSDRELVFASRNTVHPDTVIGLGSAAVAVEDEPALPSRTCRVTVGPSTPSMSRTRRFPPVVSVATSSRIFQRMLGRPLDSTESIVAGVVAAESLMAQCLGVWASPAFRVDAGIFTIGTTPFDDVSYVEPDQFDVTIVLEGHDEVLAQAALASVSSRGFPDTAVFCALTGTGSLGSADNPGRSSSSDHPSFDQAVGRLRERAESHSAYVIADAAYPSGALRSGRPRVGLVDGGLATALLVGTHPVFLTISDHEAEAVRRILATRSPLPHFVLSAGRTLSAAMRDPFSAEGALLELGARALHEGRGDSLVIASPGFASLMDPLRSALGPFVIDGLAAAIALAEALLALGRVPELKRKVL